LCSLVDWRQIFRKKTPAAIIRLEVFIVRGEVAGSSETPTPATKLSGVTSQYNENILQNASIS